MGESPQTSFRFIVTGFGPFHGVASNPTTVLCAKLVDYLKQVEDQANQQEATDDDASVLLSPYTTTRVMETSVAGVKKALTEIQQNLATTATESLGNTKTILLHLGVHGGASKFRLEQCAYNDASFRVPDEQGYQPHRVSILGGDRPVGETLTTRLDIDSLVKSLNATTTRTSHGASNTAALDNSTSLRPTCKEDGLAECSLNPGRFVCNYTYCYSMDAFQCFTSTMASSPSSSGFSADNNKETNSGGDGDRVRCLFLHVPPFKVVGEQDQLAFVSKLMVALHRQFVLDS